MGHVSPGSQLGEDAAEDALKAEKKCFIGEFCFVAGTKVLMADGSLKSIEQVKVGDLVLSKDEATGEVAPKRVTKTFVRVAPSTLALTFSNGETVETTAEHPFFVQDKGFTPAGLVALGNSIVTRAGPGLQVTGIEKKNKPQTVYNFSVEEFHTYFVENSELWVHNYRGLSSLGGGQWQSPAGLIFGNMPPNDPDGHRLVHVLKHCYPNLLKRIHSVHTTPIEDLIETLDEAWSIKQGTGTLQRNGNRFWDVDMGKVVGTAGQTHIEIVVRDGTSEIITAFPV